MKAPSKTLQFIAAAFAGLAMSTTTALAADHGDGPTVGSDQGADLADLYAFLDPTDNDKTVLILTVRGFIVPGEANNFGLFDEVVRYTLQIENTGDAIPDMFIDINFNQRQSPPAAVDIVGFKGRPRTNQDATISFRGRVPAKFAGVNGQSTAPVTQPTLASAPNPPVLTSLTNRKGVALGINFFAGERDDPFFFDLPGFNRFVSSVLSLPPAPDPTQLQRGRDTFAGYNIMVIALELASADLKTTIPASSRFTPPTRIGVSASTARRVEHTIFGNKIPTGGYYQVDREGVPGINAVIVPYNFKNAYNGGQPIDDARGKFFGAIVGTLATPGTLLKLGVGPASLVTLESVFGLPPVFPIPRGGALGTGDMLRLETNKVTAPNTGLGGGTGANGFPNGRRVQDDVIDTLVNLVTNGGITSGDNVNGNDQTFGDTFPFVAPPQQPRAPGVLDDNTRN